MIYCGADGSRIWDRNFGGSDWDFAYDLQRDSLGFIYLAGFTRSTDQDAAAPGFGLQDFWLLKCDANGQLLWTQKFGGNQNDVVHAVQIFHHDVYLLGRTNSSDGTITQSWGGRDLWLALLSQADGVFVEENSSEDPLSIFPNPAGSILTIDSKQIVDAILITNMYGQILEHFFRGDLYFLKICPPEYIC